MKKFFCLISLIFLSCNKKVIKNENIEEQESSAILIDTIDNVSFLPTLESKIDLSKNSIYSASLLYCWEDLKNKSEYKLDNFSNPELKIINQSLSYFSTLLKNEYNSEIKYDNTKIQLNSFFKKDLSFDIPMELKDTISFNDVRIKTFGLDNNNGYYQNTAQIKYYYNDEDFAIQLNPKDSIHEIILIQSKFIEHTSLKSEISRYNDLTTIFSSNKDEMNSWKYHINENDRLLIPIIDFNLYSNYPNLKNSTFKVKNKEYTIQNIRQGIKFRLDEKGALVESEFEITAITVDDDDFKSKELVFNKPFVILLKRKDSKYPYFAAYLRDARFLEKVN